MLKRVYIDNYKSLVNFELSVGEINLFFGANGAGKSAVFEALRKIRDFVGGPGKVTDLFKFDHKTRWQISRFQRFELEVEGNGGLYKYELSVEHDEKGRMARVDQERLLYNNGMLFEFVGGDVHLYRDNLSVGPVYSFDWSVSALASVPPGEVNTKLTWFKERLKRCIIAQIIPVLMDEDSPEEEAQPSRYLENFVSWYRFISQDQGMIYQLTNELKQVLPGFDSFKFELAGKHRLLTVYFQDQDLHSIGYGFDELSDGQRMLIALYSLLYFVRADTKCKYTLCLDEPDNFLALPEIQPWLINLYDSCTEGRVQALLISHHPELLNYLLASPIGYFFEHQPNRPTRVKLITERAEEGGLPVSELVARGWLNE